MLLTLIYCIAVRCHGRQHNATCRRNRTRLDSCCILHSSTYDDAVCVNGAVEINVLNYNIAVRQRMVPGLKAGNRTLASIGFIMQRVPSMLGSLLADNWSTAWSRPLPTTPMTMVPLPPPPFPTTMARDNTMTAASSRCVTQRRLNTAI